MAVDKQKLLRFKVLNECFRDPYRNYTIDDLIAACNRAMDRIDKVGVTERTIRSDIRELEMPPYNIDLVEGLRSGKKRIYKYEKQSFNLPLFTFTDEERERIDGAIKSLKRFEGTPQYDWILFCLKQIASENFHDANIISFQNNPDLFGIEHLVDLLKAIADKQPLTISYHPFPKMMDGILTERPGTTLKIYPYHLKQYNDRWFLFAKVKGSDDISNYPLDRITSLQPLNIKYVESGIDFDEYFDNAVGVSVEEEIQEVIVRVSKYRYPYIKSKPIHWSQTELREQETDTHVTLRLRLCLNKELEALLLSYSSDLEVLQPKELRDSIAKRVAQMNDFYKH